MPAASASRLQSITWQSRFEKFFGRQLAEAVASDDIERASERAQALAARQTEIDAAERAGQEAHARMLAANERRHKAKAVYDKAHADWFDTHAAWAGAGIVKERAQLAWDTALADLGGRVIDETIGKLREMQQHARGAVQYTSRRLRTIYGEGPAPAEVATPEPLQAVEACAAEVAALEALRYDPALTPADIEARCIAAVRRCLGIGGVSLWGSLTTWEPDDAVWREHIRRTVGQRPSGLRDWKPSALAAPATEGGAR